MTANQSRHGTAFSTSSDQVSRTVSQKPLRELLELLRQSTPDRCCTFSVTQAQQRQAQLGASATTVMGVCNNGMAALGHLLAHSSPVIEDGTIGADTIEALGWLLAELGDTAAYCMVLAAQNKGVIDTG